MPPWRLQSAIVKPNIYIIFCTCFRIQKTSCKKKPVQVACEIFPLLNCRPQSGKQMFLSHHLKPACGPRICKRKCKQDLLRGSRQTRTYPVPVFVTLALMSFSPKTKELDVKQASRASLHHYHLPTTATNEIYKNWSEKNMQIFIAIQGFAFFLAPP